MRGTSQLCFMEVIVTAFDKVDTPDCQQYDSGMNWEGNVP